MTTLTVKMPEKLSLRLRAEAIERGMNCSELIREAVEEILKTDARAASGTCLDLARDLAGRLQGARDLATNPERMKGFGS